MRKEIIASLAIASALTLAGCGGTTTTTTTDTSTTPAAATAPVAAAAVTADTIAAKLTAANLKFTTKDKTAAAKAAAHGSAVVKSTEFKIPTTDGKDMTVLIVTEINDAAQKTAVETDIRMGFAAATEADPNIMGVMAKLGSDTTLVGVVYKQANVSESYKVDDAIGAQ